MNTLYNPKLSSNAKALRKNMTKEERHLWYDFLKPLPFTVHRQKVLGPYIVDFYIASARLIIEIDGSQHYEPALMQKDSQRDAYFAQTGYHVVRYANSDITRNFGAVCQDILNHLPSTEKD